MKDSELQIDRSCHVLYSKPCKKEILAKITLHYPEVEREAVWEQVQLRYAELLSKWRTDLGGKKNFHNGVGGTYDCIAIMCFYDVCRDVVTFREMEEIVQGSCTSPPGTPSSRAAAPCRMTPGASKIIWRNLRL